MAEGSTETTIQFTKYYLELNTNAKARYAEKIRTIGLVDPYHHLEGNDNCFHNSRFSTVEWYEWPAVTYANVYNFLINATSYCTYEQLKT